MSFVQPQEAVMTHKFPICPDRIRTIPEQFSWVDHRLVRDRHIELLSHEAAALYLFLITVADCQGLSYYADASLCERLAMDAPTLASARACLLKFRLLAYKRPLYQVLALSDVLQPHKIISVSGEMTYPVKTGDDVGTLAIDKILASLAGGTP
jgi:hypothetical protein